MELTAHGMLLVVGIAALYFGADWLVRGSVRLAASLGIHPIVVGLTVVSMGTSAPELVVSLIAALEGNPDIAVGNVMGSNLANIGLILGLTALVRPLAVNARVVRREVPLMLLVTLALVPLIRDRDLSRVDGLILVLLLVGYLLFVFRSSPAEEPAIMQEYEQFLKEGPLAARRARLQDISLVLVGCGALVMGGTAIVRSAVYIATEMGVSQLAIGLTAVAVGTSLPELATSLVAALRQEADIAVGNIIGSNIFNVGAILGITATIAPIAVHPSILTAELPAVLLISAVLWPLTRTGFRIQRAEGALLLALYLVLTLWLVWPAAAAP